MLSFLYHYVSQGVSILTKCCYLVDCNRSGCDREEDIDWHMSLLDGPVVKPVTTGSKCQIVPVSALVYLL